MARDKGKKGQIFLICRPRYFWRLRIRRSCRKKIRERKTRKARKAGDTGNTGDVYARLDQAAGTGGNEDFWEHVLEHSETPKGYQMGAAVFGTELRRLSENTEGETDRENRLRERCMLREIKKAVEEGIPASPDCSCHRGLSRGRAFRGNSYDGRGVCRPEAASCP